MRKHRKKSYRTEEEKQRNLIANLLTAVLIVVVIGAVIGMLYHGLGKKTGESSVGKESTKGDYLKITVEDKTYEYNPSIKTILLLGIDSVGEIEKNTVYGEAPRSDTILLIALDSYQKKLSVISLNRNSMVPFRHYDLKGNPMAWVEEQLCLAYAVGDGHKASAENVAEAVQALVGGIPMPRYVVMNTSSIAKINQLLGGVSVTLPDGEMEKRYEGFTKGSTVKLNDEQAEAFVRFRDTDEDFSNGVRMERQKVFIEACLNQFKQGLLNDLEGTYEKVNRTMEECLLTNITKNQYLDYGNILKDLDLSKVNFYIPGGTDDKEEILERYYIDAASLQQILLDVYYLEK